MTAVKVQFEIGHEASIRTKKTPEGFTHDWEVFVQGQDGADISVFVDKVVFYLHETFPRPKRVVRDRPFSVKESGYAGFSLPIEIYVRNKDEPKKIKFNYDLNLPQTGPATYNVLKDRYIFQNPNEDFKRKLLSGGGIIVSNNAFYTNPDQETRSRDSFTDEKPKAKVSTEVAKKHKAKEHKEIPHKTTSFENLFGLPIQKPPKISPDAKKTQEKTSTSSKPDKKDKDRSSDKKQKYEQKDVKPEKIKIKEEKDKSKDRSSKSHSKDSDRSKDKSNKRSSDRPISPEAAKKKCPSPTRKAPSPQRSNSAASIKEEYKPKMNYDFDLRKVKIEPPDIKVEKESKEKRKKEKKSHDRDKERKEKKEHKKEHHKSNKESPKETVKEPIKEIPKPREVPKEKEIVKEIQNKDKLKPDKSYNKFSIENLRKTPQETQERLEEPKKEKSESERKHKHKKKDKKRDESREKHKDSNKEKKHKHDKVKELPPEKVEVVEKRETPVPKERPPPEPTPPHHPVEIAPQCTSKSNVTKAPVLPVNDDANSSQSESEEEPIVVEDDVKVKTPTPEPVKPPTPAPEPAQPPAAQHKEKSKKHKDKSSKREEKRRKRKAAEEEEEAENRQKVAKTSEAPVKTDKDSGGESSSGATTTETKLQDNGVSSSLGEDAEEHSPDYMEQLRELQQRIMTIKSNEELERVVNLIAETGRYEVTTQTFDFDLCLLDRATVQQLIQLVG